MQRMVYTDTMSLWNKTTQGFVEKRTLYLGVGKVFESAGGKCVGPLCERD